MTIRVVSKYFQNIDLIEQSWWIYSEIHVVLDSPNTNKNETEELHCGKTWIPSRMSSHPIANPNTQWSDKAVACQHPEGNAVWGILQTGHADMIRLISSIEMEYHTTDPPWALASSELGRDDCVMENINIGFVKQKACFSGLKVVLQLYESVVSVN